MYKNQVCDLDINRNSRLNDALTCHFQFNRGSAFAVCQFSLQDLVFVWLNLHSVEFFMYIKANYHDTDNNNSEFKKGNA